MRTSVIQLAFNKSIVGELKERLARPAKAITPSTYQQDVLDWALTGSGSAIVRAVAGSGKSTMLEMLLRTVSNGSTPTIKTLNGLGHGAVYKRLGKVKLDADKVRVIARGFMDYDQREDYGPEVTKMVGLAKAYGLVPTGMSGCSGLMPDLDSSWEWFIDHFDLDLKPEHVHSAIEIARDILRYSILDLETIDFDDQMYLPVIKDWPLWRNDWVLVDEAQDVSPIQLALLRKCILPRYGRLVAVGDEYQSIYAFRGADHEALDKIEKGFNAVNFPLSISYRCAKSIVARAQKIVPHIESAPDAPIGVDTMLDIYSAADFMSGDLVVCRNTAPVVKLAYGLLAQGLPVTVLGREIGGNLIRLIDKLKATSLLGIEAEDIYDDCLVARLDTWTAKETERLTKKDQEAKIQGVEDKRDTIMAFVESSGATTIPELKEHIDGLFENPGQVTLCTIHKAKGLEAERVFILNPSMIPSRWARSDHALKQEDNLLYVAVTRAKTYLCNIDNTGLMTEKEVEDARRHKAEQEAEARAGQEGLEKLVEDVVEDYTPPSSTYAWRITAENVTQPEDEDGLPSRVGWEGPRNAPDELLERLRVGEGLRFRMLDDDRNIYYFGQFLDVEGNDCHSLGEEAFGPLEDLGTPDAGAVIIEYLTDGKWVAL